LRWRLNRSTELKRVIRSDKEVPARARRGMIIAARAGDLVAICTCELSIRTPDINLDFCVSMSRLVSGRFDLVFWLVIENFHSNMCCFNQSSEVTTLFKGYLGYFNINLNTSSYRDRTRSNIKVVLC
jgi:hypothetical protein